MAGIAQADTALQKHCTTVLRYRLHQYVSYVTGSRNKRDCTSLGAYKPRQTLFPILLVKVYNLVGCFMQNRFLNSAALREALPMTSLCEVRGKTAPKVSEHCKISSHMEHPLSLSRSHFISPLIFYYMDLRNGKNICLE